MIFRFLRDPTKAYVLGLLMIAVMAFSAFMIMNTVISSNKQTATIINVSGKQRMLSQRLALLSN